MPSPPKPPRLQSAGSRRGRPPKPALVHQVEGTWQPSRHGAAPGELGAPGELSGKRPPAWMNDAQRKLWHEVLRDAPPGLLRRVDWALLANYIELLNRHAQAVEAQRQLDRSQPLPFLVKGKDGPALSPYLRIINHCVLLMTRLQGEMGFTPVARARFRDRESEPDEEDVGWASLGRLRVVPGGKAGDQ